VKVVADSNILVSAIHFGGKPLAILELAQEGQIELCVSEAILSETFRILRDKFGRTPEQLDADLMALEAITRRVEPVERIEAVQADPTDDRILECAVAAGGDCIVSGDRHLLSLGSFRGIRIQTAAEFLSEFQARSITS
jgi:putative PIN family toxin of toxin-antitoxin system